MRRAAAAAMVGGLLVGLATLGLGVPGAGAGSPSTSAPPSQVLTLDVTPQAASPGETFTVTMTGCVGGEVVAGLWIPFTSDPVVSTGPIVSDADPVVATLTIPLGAAATDAMVVAFCSLDPEASASVPVQILAATTTTTTTAPVPAVGGQPAFTG
jgi:hypothetical protein